VIHEEDTRERCRRQGNEKERKEKKMMG